MRQKLDDFAPVTTLFDRRPHLCVAPNVKRRQIKMMALPEMLDEMGYQSTMVDG